MFGVYAHINSRSSDDVPIVYATIAYDCSYSHMTYIMILRNVLYMPTLQHNLLSPFLMRQRNVIVDEKPKNHCKEPTSNNHCISFENNDLRIPLGLNGVFSFFHTRTPINEELIGCDKVFLTPDESQWNPYCTSFELTERSVLSYDSDISSSSNWESHNMELEPAPGEISSTKAFESAIDKNIDDAFVFDHSDNGDYSLDGTFHHNLNMRSEISQMME